MSESMPGRPCRILVTIVLVLATMAGPVVWCVADIAFPFPLNGISSPEASATFENRMVLLDAGESLWRMGALVVFVAGHLIMRRPAGGEARPWVLRSAAYTAAVIVLSFALMSAVALVDVTFSNVADYAEPSAHYTNYLLQWMSYPVAQVAAFLVCLLVGFVCRRPRTTAPVADEG